MYKVKVMNACSCFFKSGMPENAEFDTQVDAKKEAEKMFDKMQDTFCKKHEFSMEEKFGDYTLYIRPRR